MSNFMATTNSNGLRSAAEAASAAVVAHIRTMTLFGMVLLGTVLFEHNTYAGEDEDGPFVASSQGWDLTAGTPQRVDKGVIQGSVTFERWSGAETRGGGACLVADLHRGMRCESDSDCGSLPVPPGGWNYCAGINGGADKICWTRPSDNCTRSPVRDPGTYYTQAVSDRVNGKKAKWITIACMADESVPTGCGSSNPALSVSATSYLLGDDQ